jgi:hypothetical protein
MTSESKSETKGYFSNVMFIQSAIQRILYPRILRDAQGVYDFDAETVYNTINLGNYDFLNYESTNDYMFKADAKLYDTIFDSIVNNSFVYTENNVATTVIDNNYEIIPNRAILETRESGDAIVEARDLTNYKATNLYEFMINSLVVGENMVRPDGSRKILTVSDLDLFNRQDELYKDDAINYNPITSHITNDTNSLTVTDFNTGNINVITRRCT